MDEIKTLQRINQKYCEARAILSARRGIRSPNLIAMQDTMQPPLSLSSPVEINQASTSTSRAPALSSEDQSAIHEMLQSTLTRAESLPSSIIKAIKATSASIHIFHNAVNTAFNNPLLPSPLPRPAGKDERRTALDELRLEIAAEQPKKKKVNRLDEAASAVLLAWVNQNLQNPYPSNKEKAELEASSGLDSIQIYNWLIIARESYDLQPPE